MRLRTKSEQKAYLDGYKMCAECIENYLSDEDKIKLECLLSAVRNAVEIEDITKENKGEWVKIQSGDKDFPESIVCSKCKNENSHLDFNEHNEPIGKVFVKSKFCPNCGADMRPEPYKAESEGT